MGLTWSRRGRVVLVVSATLAVVLVGTLLALGVRGLLPGDPDCSVSADGRTVELDADEAERAATVSARAVRLGVPLRTTAVPVADVLDSSERDGRLVASALTGRSRHALTCTHGGAADEDPDTLDASGLTERAARVRADLDDAFGRQKVGGFAPGGVTDGHMPGSAHYEGRAVDLFFRPITRKNKTKGWAMAQYLVAHAARLEVSTVIFDGRIWTHRRAGQGWRDYEPDTSNRSAAVAAVLEHRDHVHVDVAD